MDGAKNCFKLTQEPGGHRLLVDSIISRIKLKKLLCFNFDCIGNAALIRVNTTSSSVRSDVKLMKV